LQPALRRFVRPADSPAVYPEAAAQSFAAAGVPAMNPEETETPSLATVDAQPLKLPGKGMTQHTLLYIGEGYKLLFSRRRTRFRS
jgi:hypothetical protein